MKKRQKNARKILGSMLEDITSSNVLPLKPQKGITLIALIITIIIMLILVAVSIALAINGNLFGKAGDAVAQYDSAIKNETDMGITIDGKRYKSIDDYLNAQASGIIIEYTVNGFEIEITTSWMDGRETYEEFAIRNLEGKTQTEKEQMFLEGENYWILCCNEEYGESNPIYNSIEELLLDWECEIEDVYQNEYDSFDDMLIGDAYVYPDQYDFDENSLMITYPNGEELDSSEWPFTVEFVASGYGQYTFTVCNLTRTKENSVTINIGAETYTDENRDTAIIPGGFVASQATGESTISTGLVIYEGSEPVTDANVETARIERNQFVWIPVEVNSSDTSTNIESFKRSEWSNNERTLGLSSDYVEPYTTEETAEYEAMLASVYKYHGFYIGRYETGSTTARSIMNWRKSETVVTRDAYPYAFAEWGNNIASIGTSGAAYLSQIMYPDITKYTELTNQTGVISTLCYGVQWDAALDFIKSSSYDVTNSVTWGNYQNSVFEINSNTQSNNTANTYSVWTTVPATRIKAANTVILLKTGTSETNKTKNIYDLAGNLEEWTMEAAPGSSKRVIRGGSFLQTTGNAASRNSCNPSNGYIQNGQEYDSIIGFRTTLYIK